MNDDKDEDQKKIDIGLEVPISKINFNINYQGKKLSLLLKPNEFKVKEYRKFILLVHYIKNSNEDKVKWATLDKDGKLIDEGEI